MRESLNIGFFIGGLVGRRMHFDFSGSLLFLYISLFCWGEPSVEGKYHSLLHVQFYLFKFTELKFDL